MENERIDPQPHTWYDLSPSYAGHGRAELIKPDLVMEGPALFQYDDLNGAKAILQIKSADPADDFLTRWEGGEPGVISPMRLDRYRKFSITSPAGSYEATHRICESAKTLSIGGTGNSVEIRAQGAIYNASPSAEGKYWVLPLHNMVSDGLRGMPRAQLPVIAKHPLRIYPTPDLPPGISGSKLQNAQFQANSHNAVITFKFRNRIGFIEPLPDYDDRLRQLQAGESRCLITALMVCEAGNDNVDPADQATWFPTDFLTLLSLATGVRVGAPWIEFRDAQARLCRRIHMSFGSPYFQVGHAALMENLEPNTGYLLTQCLQSSAIRARFVRIMLTHLLNTGIRQGSIEDRFLSLCRGYEALAHHYNLATQDLAAGLDAGNSATVSAVLNKASETIRKTATQSADGTQKNVLFRIADKARSSSQRDRSFGDAVASVADILGFADPGVLRDGYSSTCGMSWNSQLSELRGAAVHEGAFDFTSGRHDAREIVRVSDHLHDLLFRIAFRILGSQAPYQSPIFPIGLLRKLDWVTPTTSADQLIAPPNSGLSS